MYPSPLDVTTLLRKIISTSSAPIQSIINKNIIYVYIVIVENLKNKNFKIICITQTASKNAFV